MEIERKFIVDKKFIEGLIKTLGIQGSNIRQFYTKIGDKEERYREENGIYYHTIKTKTSSGLVRYEDEVRCSKDEFVNNYDKRIGNVIEKTRFGISSDSYLYEFDIYSGRLEGLSVCEIEFDNEYDAKLFQPTNLFIKEVTFDERYKNQSLAVNGLPEEQEQSL